VSNHLRHAPKPRAATAGNLHAIGVTNPNAAYARSEYPNSQTLPKDSPTLKPNLAPVSNPLLPGYISSRYLLFQLPGQAFRKIASIPIQQQPTPQQPPDQVFSATPLKDLTLYTAPIDCPFCRKRGPTIVTTEKTPMSWYVRSLKPPTTSHP